jgi:hypothetical protein
MINRCCVLVLLVAAVVPAAPAAAATPAITIDAVESVGLFDIAVSGTLTCSQPTGPADVRYLATSSHGVEVAEGIGETSVPCGNGPVPWVATARSVIIRFDDAFPLFVVASFRREGVQEAATMRQFPRGWGAVGSWSGGVGGPGPAAPGP